MSKKRKLTHLDSTQVVEIIKESELVTYNSFISRCVSKKLVRAGQEKEIHAFFKSLGLTDKEPSDKYSKALLKY